MNIFTYGESFYKVGVGFLFIKYKIVAKAYDKYCNGIEVWDKSAKSISTICKCLYFERPLYSGVCGGVVRCVMPWVERKFSSAMYSPPLSE